MFLKCVNVEKNVRFFEPNITLNQREEKRNIYHNTTSLQQPCRKV